MNSSIHAIITVRTNSSRLPQKCMMKIELPDGRTTSILELVLNRAKHFSFIPIVATTTDVSDDAIRQICAAASVQCFSGSADDKLARWLDACRHFKIDKFVTIDADDPLFDPFLTRRSFELLGPSVDAVSPCSNTYTGSVGWSLTVDLLEKAVAQKTTDKTEMMWKHLPADSKIVEGAVWKVMGDRIESKLRLTLDYPEDFWLIQTIVRKLGEFCNRTDILEYFSTRKGLTDVNYFRQEQWKSKQDNG